MDLTGILLICSLVFLSFNCNVVEGRHRLTANEDLEIERQVEMLNKSPLKTVKTKGGDIIDCIDIHKQPTLDHPLLKNHKIQMRPTNIPTRSIGSTISTPLDSHETAMSSNVNCPHGTVPIRRTQREDLIRAKAFSESFSSNIHPLTGLTPGKHQAIVRSVFNPKYTYKGIEGAISVYNPVVGTHQSTFAQIWIENGAKDIRNSLQAGWMVAPDLYGDNQTRSFAYWNVQGETPQGCFNYLCLGFVQVDKKYIIGSFLQVSDEKNQYFIDLQIFQDSTTGDWWLRAQNIGVNIGYWPKALLPELSNGASIVVWGGQAIGKRYGASPGMCNGRIPHPHDDWSRSCYIDQMKVIDTSFLAVPPAVPKYQTETFVDNTDCYKLEKYAYNGKYHGCSFLFGGPGGNNSGA